MAQISLGLLMWLMFHWNRGTGRKRWVISWLSAGCGFFAWVFPASLTAKWRFNHTETG